MTRPLEVWAVRKVQLDSGRWGIQVVSYLREPREDGLLLWKLGSIISEAMAHSVANLNHLKEVGHATALPHDPEARHGGVALDLSDLLLPEEEALWRLEGVMFKLVWTHATKKRTRILIGLARKVGGRWLFERRVATVSLKQSNELVKRIGLDFHMVMSMPRTKGRPVPVNQDKP